MPHAWDADPVLTNGRIPSFPSMKTLVATYARGLVARYLTHGEMLAKFARRLAPLAARYGFHAAFVNATGTPHPLIPCVGPCFVVAPDGKVTARTRSKREGIVFADLDGAAGLDDDPVVGGMTYDAGRIELPDGPGHGADIKPEVLQRLQGAVVYAPVGDEA